MGGGTALSHGPESNSAALKAARRPFIVGWPLVGRRLSVTLRRHKCQPPSQRVCEWLLSEEPSALDDATQRFLYHLF
ncbi:hypothetical protein D3227_31935 [Mesorhizobium waimense]|uniref:Uncharacterized protein n=2 Tax=Mesorhizobium waimense TaxID=1300307 RepID=A0A3A5K4H2_9HYPH|nr:hypothetical protein D3227_31935 [Mesorhizobium waimense]